GRGDAGHEVMHQFPPRLSVRVPPQRSGQRAEFVCADTRWAEAEPVRRNIGGTHLAGPHVLLLFTSGDPAAIETERFEHDGIDGGPTEWRFFSVLRDNNRSCYEPAISRKTNPSQPDEPAYEDHPRQTDSAADRGQNRAAALLRPQQQRAAANSAEERAPGSTEGDAVR